VPSTHTTQQRKKKKMAATSSNKEGTFIFHLLLFTCYGVRQIFLMNFNILVLHDRKLSSKDRSLFYQQRIDREARGNALRGLKSSSEEEKEEKKRKYYIII
jgi:hypothetical protein